MAETSPEENSATEEIQPEKTDMSQTEGMQDPQSDALEKPKRQKKRHVLRNTIIIIAIVLVLAIAVLLFLIFRGVIAPDDAAAKYDVLSYITEDEVTEYVDTYRTEMGYAESDEAWAEFLGDNGLTPDLMRYATIRQLIIDNEVERKAASHGISVDESEVDAYIDEMKNNLTFNSDTIWAETLEMYGTTEEEVRAMEAHSLLQNALCQEEVPVPSVNDEEIFDYLVAYYPTGLKAKHIYYLTMEVEDPKNDMDDIATIQQVQKMLAAEPDLTPEIFADYVTVYCTDDDVVSRGGANGWSVDMEDYSESYQTTVENTKKGQVSDIFREEDGDKLSFSIVWIDDVVKLPDISEEDTENIDQEEYLSVLPDTLKSYFSDCTAQIKWNSDCQEYLDSLYDESDPVLYPVYGVPSYYVDMSDVTVRPQESNEEITTDDTASDDSGAAEEGEESSQEDATANSEG